ncbi:hypothetical protein F53441_12774 [Fusarium austroafricanum]|uniref:C2H2-type domain-containing protein n=1 Tax=Fusarium austroafricanum TaxID=2364996 RepID=A0A8H4JWP3_9HYPO|nr:hypothetical protein F53441_12774 [Fusarium austroafricanum]
MDSFNSPRDQRNSANVSPQSAQEQDTNLAALGQPRSQAPNPFWQNWTGDEPWNPLSFGTPNDGQTRSQLIGSANFQTSYQDYRSKPLLSECDTNPEDSAYGSRLTHSIGNPSAYGEDIDPDIQTLESQNPDAQLVNRNLETLQLQCQPASSNSQLYQDQWVRPHPPASVATAPVGGERRWVCGDCQKRCRTRSELSDRTVSGRTFVCNIGNCAKKSKVWPRADNFRSHLQRIHSKIYSANDDLSEYVHRPVPSQDLEGVGGSAMAYLQAQEQSPGLVHPSAILSFRGPYGDRRASQPQHGTNNLSRGSATVSLDQDASGLATVREGDEGFIQPDILNDSDPLPPHRWTVPTSSEEDAPGDDITASESGQPDDIAPEIMDGVQQGGASDTETSSLSEEFGPQQPDVRMIDADEAQRTPRATLSQENSTTDSPNTSPGSAYDAVLDTIPKELIASYLKKHLVGSRDETPKPDTSRHKSQTHLHKCQDCEKAFPRLCELKKHQKRHSKPYGCTFIGCKKSFGSKNDWKRHESIQHYQLETWICDFTKSDSGEACNKVCYRRESFRNHLGKEHTITDSRKLEEKVESCRRGRHCDAHFWCGFCQETVEIKETDNTWAKRCDHIDNHFSGRQVPQRDISEWIHEKDHRTGVKGLRSVGLGSSSSSSTSDPKSPQSSVSPENSGEDRQSRKKEMYMWTCLQQQHAMFDS